MQDIKHGHGVFFLDTHGDAIDDIVNRPYLACYLLDPESDTHDFAINLLECSDIKDQRPRNDTYNKAKSVFDKLWKNTFEERPRLGQLGDNKEIIGATAAIANKVLFQVTGRDAGEFAPEFAKEPTVETRFEDQFVISQNPFWDLLHGHSNPEVRNFIEKYLRPIKERTRRYPWRSAG